MSVVKYFTFMAGDVLLGVEVERVIEVVRDVEITPVPLTSDQSIVGVFNLRGLVITAIDTRTRLGLHSLDQRPGNLTVIMRIGTDEIGFLIDREGDVVELDEQQRSDVPDTVDTTLANFASGTYATGTGLLLTLDTERVLAVDGLLTGSQGHK